ncbi:DNA-binding transcriptional regulator, LysR family [Pseudovibrio ascidiaceicola]|uniref:DNA-binding transcriptional regulator, LysR family n=1 Tax=Pseudovibrio ascidiaceicola TaxID=285279 RepID=A0A1I4FZ82_9HYPH|nr:LysR family transcriptional regulator [Pseudovibrio ascidiaceicola]SFL22041.1 DNA-binding transcriptional regulator, LysR family [Pseudovibrio ascidiaceicola]
MIDKLEMFIALAREKHFGKAADECGVTQPTLSANIKHLEEQLGALLVLRGSRFQGLTPEGERVLEWARKLVADTRTMKQELKAVSDGQSGTLRIASIPTALTYVPELTTCFSEENPGVDFAVFSRPSSEILAQLENLEIDVGLTYLDNEPLGRVLQIPLYRERYCFVVAEGGPLSGRENATLEDVSRVPLCLLTSDMQCRRIINNILHDVDVVAKPVLQSDSIMCLLAHVRTGRWGTIIPQAVAQTIASDHLEIIPISDPYASIMVGLIATQREPRAPLLDIFLKRITRISQGKELST